MPDSTWSSTMLSCPMPVETTAGRNPKTLMEMAAIVDKFFSDRDSHLDDPRWAPKKPYSLQPQVKEKTPAQTSTSNANDTPTPMQTGVPQNKTTGRQKDPNWEAKIECFICKKKGHAAYRCPDKVSLVDTVHAADVGLLVEGKVGEKPTAMLLDSGAALTLIPPELAEASGYTGKRRTVMGATGPGTFPTLPTTIEVEERKSQMTVLVKEGLQQPLLGRDFPGFYQLLVETIQKNEEKMGCQAEEAEDSNTPVLAVQTRSQKKLDVRRQEEDDLATATSDATPWDLDDSLFGESRPRERLSRRQKKAQAEARTSTLRPTTLAELTPSELQEAQAEDDSLQTLMEAAEKGEGDYLMRGQTLYHRSEDDWGNELEQLVIPAKYRSEVLAMAHGSPLAAHLGKKKTIKRVLKEFFWPGLSRDVADYCQRCEQCQRGAKANRQRAPLQPLPAIEESFKRIAIDIVGSLRRTKKGNKYILTMMDFATRYPEAIPLRRIDAATVAETLCETFTRLGLPEEMLSDQGSNFTSTLMKKVTELLQIHHLKTSPYHPQTDGMLERFHGTLKGMMRKTSRANKGLGRVLAICVFCLP